MPQGSEQRTPGRHPAAAGRARTKPGNGAGTRPPLPSPAFTPPPHLVAEGGAAHGVPQQLLADVSAGAVGDEVEVQPVPAAQPSVAQQGAQRDLALTAQRRAALHLGEHHQEVQRPARLSSCRRPLAAGRAGRRGGRRGGPRGAEAAGGAGEGLPAAAQVVEGAHGQGRRQRQRARLRARPAHSAATRRPPPCCGPAPPRARRRRLPGARNGREQSEARCGRRGPAGLIPPLSFFLG